MRCRNPALISERAFQRSLIQAGNLLGWHVYSIPDSRKCTSPGYPDLTFMHPGNGRSGSGDFFLCEVKSENGVLSREQVIWIAGLQAAGIEIVVWRPSDLDIAIERLSQKTQGVQRVTHNNAMTEATDGLWRLRR